MTNNKSSQIIHEVIYVKYLINMNRKGIILDNLSHTKASDSSLFQKATFICFLYGQSL